MNIITLDAEIGDNLKRGDPRWSRPQDLTLSVLALNWNNYSQTETHVYLPDPVAAQTANHPLTVVKSIVQRALDSADFTVTFNGERFDFPLLEGAGFDMKRSRDTSFDILAAFEASAGHRISLDALLKALSIESKELSGALAPVLWTEAAKLLPEARAFLFNTVINYCVSDVAKTRELFDTLVAFNGKLEYYHFPTRAMREIRLQLPDAFQSVDTPDEHRQQREHPELDDWDLEDFPF